MPASARPAYRSETSALPHGAPVVVLVNGAARSAGPPANTTSLLAPPRYAASFAPRMW